MAGFQFRYQKVLEVRQREEDEKKQALASKIADRERIKLALEKARQDKIDYEKKVVEEMTEGVSASRASSYNRFKIWHREEVLRFENLFKTASKEVLMARERLILATQEVKKIEKLKEKALAEYKFNEEKAMNEMIEEAIGFQLVNKSKN